MGASGTARLEVSTKGTVVVGTCSGLFSPSPSQLSLVLSVACVEASNRGAREMPSAGLVSQDRKGQSKAGTRVFEVEQIETLIGLE